MAIVKMKKLRLMVIRSQKDALLRDLERKGCVEVSELDESLAESGLCRESADALGQRNAQNSVLNAIALLDRYAPEKKPLLSPKPQVELDTLLDESGLDAATKTAAQINSLEEQIKRLSAEESRQESIGETEEVLEIKWIYCRIVLNPALKDRFCSGEYLVDRRNSGPA